MDIKGKISHERKKLENMILANVTYTKILKQSQKLDKLITIFYTCK